MEFSAEIYREDLEEIRDYVDNFIVRDMDRRGLGFAAMAIILQSINNEVERLEKLLEDKS